MDTEDHAAKSTPSDVIDLVESSSDEEEEKAAPANEVLGKRKLYQDSNAAGVTACMIKTAESDLHHGVALLPADGAGPPCKRKLCKSFLQAAIGSKPSAAPPVRAVQPKPRPPPPTRLNYVIREVNVWSRSALVEQIGEAPRTPPDAKAMICTSPLSTFKLVAHPRGDGTSATVPTKTFSTTPWPARVVYLHDYYNPKSIKLPRVDHFGDCGCADPCKIETCRNARMNIFCTDMCCCWEELCANRPRESDKVEVMQDADSLQYALVAKSSIKAGEVLGEYLGQFRCIPNDPARRSRNQGYMLSMRARTDGFRKLCVGIDAHHLGGRMRFVNHSCTANARFFEFANGRRHTVVVVTTQAIFSDQEVTVNYGKDLWFVCRCKATSCEHRDIQDHEDP